MCIHTDSLKHHGGYQIKKNHTEKLVKLRLFSPSGGVMVGI